MRWSGSRSTATPACAKAGRPTPRSCGSATPPFAIASRCCSACWRQVMQAEDHLAAVRRIEASLQRCEPDDHEMLIEGAMLAGTHRLNALLHCGGIVPASNDVMHS